MTTTHAVNHQSDAIVEMAKQWAIIDALMRGTPAMREAGGKYLPRWPNEEAESYKTRLSTATLFPAFERTVSVMSGKPFAKALTLSEDTPEQIVGWSDDIDLEGVNLHSFASEMFTVAMAWGYGGILVDAPKPIAPANGREPTRKEQTDAGVRPYFVRVHPLQVLGWRTSRGPGPRRLTQLRIAEISSEEDGDYGDKPIFRVRVLTPGAYELWEAGTTATNPAITATTSWTRIEEGRTGVPLIPFVPVYGAKTGFMTAKPPLLNLAYLNVKHWQSQSDQDTILHVARVPILFGKQLGEASIVVGANTAVKAEFEGSDLYFVEHTGASIAAGRQSLIDLEEQMIQSGAELLVKKPGQRSATESANDAEANKSDLQRIVENLEDSLDLALFYMAQFASVDKGGKATLFKDYGAATLGEASGQLILSLQQSGLITKATALKEQQRRGILSADVDPEVELAKAEEEGPAPGAVDDDE